MISLDYINLIFCIVTFFYGLWVYKKSESHAALWISLAFGFFGVTHLAPLLDVGGFHPFLFVAFRALGYLFGLGALVSLAGKKK